MDPSCYPLIQVSNCVGQKSELLNKSWVTVGLSVWGGKSNANRLRAQLIAKGFGAFVKEV
jgi:hypothetical protein